MNQQFNITRIGLLIRNEFWIKWKLHFILLCSAIVLCIAIYIAPQHNLNQYLNFNPYSLTQNLGGNSNVARTITTYNYSTNSSSINGYSTASLKYHLDWFPQLLYFIGFLLTSLTFWEYREGKSRSYHLSLPASKLEKWFSKAFITTILFPAGFVLFYHLYAKIIYQIGPPVGIEYVKIGLFDPYIWQVIIKYVVIQSIVLLGSIYYNKYSFLKSALTVYLLYLLKNLVVNVIVGMRSDKIESIINSNLLSDASRYASSENHSLFYNLNSYMNDSFWPSSIWVWGGIVIPLVLYIVYSKFQEIEA